MFMVFFLRYPHLCIYTNLEVIWGLTSKNYVWVCSSVNKCLNQCSISTIGAHFVSLTELEYVLCLFEYLDLQVRILRSHVGMSSGLRWACEMNRRDLNAINSLTVKAIGITIGIRLSH